MIDGISVVLPTWDHLNYLKKCIYSIKKYSVLPNTEVVLFVDGSTDGTFEWLIKQGIPHLGRKEHIGCFSGWNRAVENSKNEVVFQGEDDLFFGPEWDLKLARWIEELGGDYIVMPQLVEPIHGSYVEYDCGKSIEAFDEAKFVSYCGEIAKHEIIAEAFGLLTVKKSMWLDIGGFDEYYDPFSMGTIDLTVRLHKTHPNLRFLKVWDSLMYHFPPILHRPYYYENPEVDKNTIKNEEYFNKKHGLTIPDAYASIPVGLK